MPKSAAEICAKTYRKSKRQGLKFEIALIFKSFNSLRLSSLQQTMGTLRKCDGNTNKNRLLRSYSNSFKLYRVAELSSNRTDRISVQVGTENENSPSCVHVLQPEQMCQNV